MDQANRWDYLDFDFDKQIRNCQPHWEYWEDYWGEDSYDHWYKNTNNNTANTLKDHCKFNPMCEPQQLPPRPNGPSAWLEPHHGLHCDENRNVTTYFSNPRSLGREPARFTPIDQYQECEANGCSLWTWWAICIDDQHKIKKVRVYWWIWLWVRIYKYIHIHKFCTYTYTVILYTYVHV